MKNKTKSKLKRKARCWVELIRNHIFVDYLHKRNVSEVATRITKYAPVLKKYKAYLDMQYKEVCKQFRFEYDPDPRTGVESYGYESIEHVNDTLNYVSDRFNIEHRIQWLIDLPGNIVGIPERCEEELAE